VSYKSVNDSQNPFLRSLIQTVVSIMGFESLEEVVCYRGLKTHVASQKRSFERIFEKTIVWKEKDYVVFFKKNIYEKSVLRVIYIN
jgi:hypothetical protein